MKPIANYEEKYTTADRIGKREAWDMQMKENRKNAAIQNLAKINNS